MVTAVLALLLAVPDTVPATAPVLDAPVSVAAPADPGTTATVPERSHRFDGLRAADPTFPMGPAAARPAFGPPPAPSDSGAQQRPVLVDYSDAYFTRLTIHKWSSWAMLPLFGLAYYTGQDLYKNGRDAPQWERNIHGPVAGSLAGLFVVNTVTGGMNLWEARNDPNGRKWRTAHSVLMLLADAGFAAVGLTAPENEGFSGVVDPGSSLGESEGNARLHRGLAVGSMAVAVVSWVMMLPPFRRD